MVENLVTDQCKDSVELKKTCCQRFKSKVWKSFVEVIQLTPKKWRLSDNQRELHQSALNNGLKPTVYDLRGHIRPKVGIVFNDLNDVDTCEDSLVFEKQVIKDKLMEEEDKDEGSQYSEGEDDIETLSECPSDDITSISSYSDREDDLRSISSLSEDSEYERLWRTVSPEPTNEELAANEEWLHRSQWTKCLMKDTDLTVKGVAAPGTYSDDEFELSSTSSYYSTIEEWMTSSDNEEESQTKYNGFECQLIDSYEDSIESIQSMDSETCSQDSDSSMCGPALSQKWTDFEDIFTPGLQRDPFSGEIKTIGKALTRVTKIDTDPKVILYSGIYSLPSKYPFLGFDIDEIDLMIALIALDYDRRVAQQNQLSSSYVKLSDTVEVVAATEARSADNTDSYEVLSRLGPIIDECKSDVSDIKDLLLQLNDLMAASDEVAIPQIDVEITEQDQLSSDQELITRLPEPNQLSDQELAEILVTLREYHSSIDSADEQLAHLMVGLRDYYSSDDPNTLGSLDMNSPQTEECPTHIEIRFGERVQPLNNGPLSPHSTPVQYSELDFKRFIHWFSNKFTFYLNKSA